MDKFVTRAPTWKTMTFSTITTNKKTTTTTHIKGRASLSVNFGTQKPLQEKNVIMKSSQDRRLSIRDEKLFELLSTPPDQPLLDTMQEESMDSGYFRCVTPTNAENVPPSTKEVATLQNKLQTPRKASDYLSGSWAPSNKILVAEAEKDNVPYEVLLYGDTNMAPKSSTPAAAATATTPAKAKIPNSILDRVQSDLNSPSAFLRTRALMANRTENYAPYTVFDVPHEEQDIITAEERRPAPPQPTIQEIMKEVIVYVEVRTGDDNRTAGIKKVISDLGAQVNDKLLRNTTHVVFKDGLLSTYKKAKNWNIPIVSILWIEACKKQLRICDPKEFPISNVDRYENPELYEKIKRVKSIQPDSELNKRVRVKAGGTPKETTPKTVKGKLTKKTTTSTTSTPRNTKTDISTYFKQSDKLTNKNNLIKGTEATPATPNVDSPATRLLNRINANAFPTPLTNLTTKMNGIEINDEVSNDAPSYTGGAAAKQTTPKDIKRSLQFKGAEENKAAAATPSSAVKNNLRRRSTTFTLTSMNVTATPKSARKQANTTPKRHEIASIREEGGGGAATGSISSRTRRRTTYSVAKIPESPAREAGPVANNATDLAKKQNLRRTLFTPQAMELTNNQTQEQVQEDQQSINENPTPQNRPSFMDVCSSTLIENTTTAAATGTPEQMKTLIEEQALVFSSTREPSAGPRSLFDVGMDIITQRMQNINRTARRSLAVPALVDQRRKSMDVNIGDAASIGGDITKSSTTPNLPSQVQAQVQSSEDNTPNGTKKRKLFMPLDESLTPTLTKTPITAALSTASKKRRSLMPATPESSALIDGSIAAKTTAVKIGKTAARNPRRSTLLFEPPKEAATDYNSAISCSSVGDKKKPTSSPKTKRKLTAKDAPIDDRKVLVYTNMHTEQIVKLREALSKLGGFRMEYTVDDTTTHLVTLEPRRTLNMLRALVRGLWIISYHWVEESMRKGKWLGEEEFEMQDFSRSVKICRAERQAFGHSYRCELFVDVGPFYVSTHCGPVSKENLKELITLCGGKVVEIRKRAKYILTDRHKMLDDKIYVTPYWILDSITQMQLLHFQKYTIPCEVLQPRLCFQPYQSHSKVLKALQVTHMSDVGKMLPPPQRL